MKKSIIIMLCCIVSILFVSCKSNDDKNDWNIKVVNHSTEHSNNNSKSLESNAMEAYKKVLENKATFIDTEDKKPVKLNKFLEPEFEITRFALVDLDGDGVPEVVLESTIYNTVLHYSDDKVYGYNFVHRGLKSIKTDGTFNFSSGAADSGYGKLRFTDDTYEEEILGHSESSWENNILAISFFIDHKNVTEEEFFSFSKEQNSKEDVIWYDFNQENIEEQLSTD